MEFVTVKEKAIEWNLSEKRVQVLCNENKILGAKKINNSWIIPANYKKPLNDKEKYNLEITPLDLAFLSECIIEDQNIVTNYKINYNLTKDNMLNPEYNLKKLYSVIFILDKYYNFDLEKYIGNDLNKLDEYTEKIQAKHILTKTEVNNEFNKFVLLISKLILDFLNFIKSQKDNLGIATLEAEAKYNKDNIETLKQFIDVVLEYHSNEIEEMFKEVFKVLNENGGTNGNN